MKRVMLYIAQILALLSLCCFFAIKSFAGESPGGIPAGEEIPSVEENSSLSEEDPSSGTPKPRTAWTVLFYICGSELESTYGYASNELSEICSCIPLTRIYNKDIRELYGLPEEESYEESLPVDVLIQTGGAMEWHAFDNGLFVEPDPGVLQRWSIEYRTDALFDAGQSDLVLKQTLESASMSDPETLADFIRWGVQTAPAEKYALVLWGHGMGSKSGILIDELYEQDILELDELAEALSAGGTHFETILFDACMMANLETAYAVCPYASWMVGSEELVPGTGTASGSWLQELYNNPLCDGRELGRAICNFTYKWYCDRNEDLFKDMATWSVINLDKIEAVVKSVDEAFRILGQVYEHYPTLTNYYMEFINNSESYGVRADGMIDVTGVFYAPNSNNFIENKLRTYILSALNEAIDYNLKGADREGAYGLSFCYAANFTEEELDVYAENCPLPNYLAFLDAISPWNAPERLYETVEKLKDVHELPEYNIVMEKCMVNGLPGFHVNRFNNSAYYRLYRLDEETGLLERLGRTACRYQYFESDGSMRLAAEDLTRWTSVSGELCDMEMIFSTADSYVYNIPIQMGTEQLNLRCGREFGEDLLALQLMGDSETPNLGKYKIYGIWDGFDSDAETSGRDIKQLSSVDGREFRLLYPLYSEKGEDTGEMKQGCALRMLRVLDTKQISLPPGTYYLQYEFTNIFGRDILLDMLRIDWDGEKAAFPGDFVWEGTVNIAAAED